MQDEQPTHPEDPVVPAPLLQEQVYVVGGGGVHFSHEYILPNGMTLVKTLLYVDLKQVRPLSYNQNPVQSASSRHMSVAFCKSKWLIQFLFDPDETEG